MQGKDRKECREGCVNLAYNYKLKKQFNASVVRVYKQLLEDVELILSVLESFLDKVPELSEEGIPQFEKLENTYKQCRKRILRIANDEIRRMDSLIDTLDIQEKSIYRDIIVFDLKD